MAPKRIALEFSPAGFAALDAVQFDYVHRTALQPHGFIPGRMTKPQWLSRTVRLTPAMDKVLDKVLAMGGIHVSRDPAVPVVLSPAGRALWSEWDTEARRRGLHPNQRHLRTGD